MRVLAILSADGGTVANVIHANAAADWPGSVDVTTTTPRPGPGWTYAGGVFAPPTAPAAAPVRHVTRLAFRNRLTQAELVGLEMAALDNPAGTAAQREQAAAIRVMLASLQAATYIDLDRPDTRAGVQQLEALGLLGAGRATAVLDAPVTDVERPA